MAPKSKVKTFHDLELGRSLTLSGGFCPSKQFVPLTRDFTFTSGSGEAAQGRSCVKECVLLSHKEPWLCEIATGQAVFQRPLARVRIIRDMCHQLANGKGDVDKKLASLAFDDGDSEDVATPIKGQKPGRDRKKKSTAVAGPEICKQLDMPAMPHSRASNVPVHAALDKQRRLWLDITALPWLIRFIKQEKEEGGVAPVEDALATTAAAIAEDSKQTSRIYWNFRDDNWIARAQAVDGSWLQTSRGVKRKHKAGSMDFAKAKHAAFCDLEEWVTKVETGEVSAEVADDTV